MPCVERKDLLGTRSQGCPSPRDQGAAAWLKWVVCIIGGGQAMGEGERVWSLIICDHQIEQIDMPG
jgi:hypothetical protein